MTGLPGLTGGVIRALKNQFQYLQEEVTQWSNEVFGPELMTKLPENAIRVLEEVAEAGQSVGLTRELAHKVIDQVYDRPVNPDTSAEFGGILICLLRFMQACQVNGGQAIVDELMDINTEERKEKIGMRWHLGQKVRTY